MSWVSILHIHCPSLSRHLTVCILCSHSEFCLKCVPKPIPYIHSKPVGISNSKVGIPSRYPHKPPRVNLAHLFTLSITIADIQTQKKHTHYLRSHFIGTSAQSQGRSITFRHCTTQPAVQATTVRLHEEIMEIVTR